MIFCFVGAHGTGKSTILEALKNKLDIPVIEGNSRKYIKNYEVDRNDIIQNLVAEDLYTQIYKKILSNQNAIFSRSPVDTFSYSIVNNLSPYMQELWKERIKDLSQNIVYFYTPIEFDLIDDGVRGSDREHQNEVDLTMSNTLKELSLRFHVVIGTADNRLKTVEELIKSYTNGFSAKR